MEILEASYIFKLWTLQWPYFINTQHVHQIEELYHVVIMGELYSNQIRKRFKNTSKYLENSNHSQLLGPPKMTQDPRTSRVG